MVFQNGDFVEIEYTGMIKEGSVVFDTTSEEVAKEKGIHNPRVRYGSISVCLGEGHILSGLDRQLIGKDVGEYKFEIPAESAFGKKSAKLLRLIPQKVFTQQKIQPFTGREVNIDGMNGIVRSVGGGRTIVDFNHPLAGKDLVYKVNLIRQVTDLTEKVKGVLRLELHLSGADVKVEDGKATVMQELPAELSGMMQERITKLIPEIKQLEFVKKEAPKDDKAPDTPSQ